MDKRLSTFPVMRWMVRLTLPVLFAMPLSQGWAGPVYSVQLDDTGGVVPEPQNGVVEKYWPEGGLFYRAFLKDGKLDGVFEKWHEDGTPMESSNFRQGIFVDTMFTWHSNGQPSELTIFEDGNPIWTQNWNYDGSLRFQSFRFKDSTYRTIRWNEAGYVTKDTLEVCPRVRLRGKL